MSVIVAYISILVVFGIIDAIWITQVAVGMYRTMLGDAMLDTVRILPAVIFYFAFPIGIVVFAVMPGLREDSVVSTIGLAMLYGALCYATYDLTNYATLKAWTPLVTVIDIVYGAVVSGFSAAVAFYAVRAVQGS